MHPWANTWTGCVAERTQERVAGCGGTLLLLLGGAYLEICRLIYYRQNWEFWITLRQNQNNLITKYSAGIDICIASFLLHANIFCQSLHYIHLAGENSLCLPRLWMSGPR